MKYSIEDTTLTEIADSVREKTGSTETIKVSDLSKEITDIPSVNNQDKEITENGEYTADNGYTGLGKVTVNVSSSGGGSIFTGHYDTAGLKEIGWTDEEIQYYQDNGVQWNEEDDEYFKLNDDDKAGTLGTNIKFLPKSSTLTSFGSYSRLLAMPTVNTSAKTSTSSMFQSCFSLAAVPLIDIGKSLNTSYMFQNCYSLETIPQLNTSKSANMSYMFQRLLFLKNNTINKYKRCYKYVRLISKLLYIKNSSTIRYSKCYKLI